MRKSTLTLVIAILGVILCAVLLAGIFGGVSSSSSVLGDLLGCDHVNTTKKYESNGSLGHSCIEVCSDCGMAVSKVSESHATFTTDIHSTTVNGSAHRFHEVEYECRECHYTYKEYQSHVYNSYNSICMGCGDLCQHPNLPTTPGADGKIRCPVCPYWEDPSSTCDHDWKNSVCENCGMTCTHTSGLGYDNFADEPYYYCYTCDYIKVGPQ